MHENHEPSCALCGKFVLPLEADSPLADWGYCAREVKGAPPGEDRLREIDQQARRGDYGFLRDKKLPLYEGLGEGCEEFEDTGHHH